MDPVLLKHPYESHPYYKDHFSHFKPDTWDHNGAILERIEALDAGFASGNAAGEPLRWLFSTEIEFRINDCSMAASPPTASAKDLRNYRLRAQEILARKLTGDEAADRAVHERIAAVEEFDVRDLIIFDIYEEMGDLVEFRFGRQEHGIGYYDNPDVAEIRLRPAPPLEFLANYHRLVAKTHEVAKRYTSIVPAIKRNHINFSLNRRTPDGYESLMESRAHDPRAQDIVRRAFAGILAGFRDTELADSMRPGRAVTFDLGTSRGHAFRLAKNRAEYRMGEGEEDHMAHYVLRIMGGAAYGVGRGTEKILRDSVKIPEEKTAGIFLDESESPGTAFSESFYAARVLEGCALNGDGSFEVPQCYLSVRKEQIEEELFGFGDGRFFDFLAGGRPAETRLLREVFGRVRLGQNGRLDLAALRQWEKPPLQLVDAKRGERPLDRAARRLENIVCAGAFNTLASPGYALSFDKSRWNEHVQSFAQSSVNRAIYGDVLHEDLALRLAGRLFSFSLAVEDKTRPAARSISHEAMKIKRLVADFPGSLGARLLGELSEGLKNVAAWNGKGIESAKNILAKYESHDVVFYWSSVRDRREEIAARFIAPLQKFIDHCAAGNVTAPALSAPRV